MTTPNYDVLKLENQLCFPLYACARETVRLYTPYLDALGLTYTQYITMMVLWEKDNQLVGDICQRLKLDTNTLTPMLQRMLPRVAGAHHGTGTDIVDEVEAHGGNGRLAVKAPFLFHLAKDMLHGFLLVLAQGKGFHHQWVALYQFGCRKAYGQGKTCHHCGKY